MESAIVVGVVFAMVSMVLVVGYQAVEVVQRSCYLPNGTSFHGGDAGEQQQHLP